MPSTSPTRSTWVAPIASTITLRASSLNNLSGGNGNFAATDVVLAGLTSSTGPANSGTGTLSVDADNIELGCSYAGPQVGLDKDDNPILVRFEVKASNLAVSGFAHTSLTASGDIRGIGVSMLDTGGDLDLNATRRDGGQRWSNDHRRERKC